MRKKYDILRGIGILLVILGHLSLRVQYHRIIAYSFHMPLFFIISGYFTKDRTFKETIKKELNKSIKIAYIFVILDIIIYLLKTDVWEIKEILKIFLIFNGSLINSPIWFLFTLSACKAIYSLIGKSKKAIYSMFIATTMFCIFNFNKILPDYWLFNTIVVMPFYLTGVMFKEKKILDEVDKKGKGWLFIFTFILILIALFNGYTDLNVHINGKSYLLFYITGVIGTLCCKSLSNFISESNNLIIKMLEKMGKNSLMILVTHYYLCRGLFPKIFEKFNLLNYQYNVIVEFVLTIGLFVLYYIAFIILEKYKKNKLLSIK